MNFDKRHSKFKVYKDIWYLIPTIIFQFDDRWYRDKNFSLEFHWLCFHGRLMWFEEEKKDDKAESHS